MSNEQLKLLYESYVKPLPREDRLRLLVMTARDLEDEHGETGPAKHSILELGGLGKEIWEGVDPQEYIDNLRDEWDRSPAE